MALEVISELQIMWVFSGKEQESKENGWANIKSKIDASWKNNNNKSPWDNRVWPVVKKQYIQTYCRTLLKHILTVPIEDTAAATTS